MFFHNGFIFLNYFMNYANETVFTEYNIIYCIFVTLMMIRR